MGDDPNRMPTPWDVLREAGVPDGAPRRPSTAPLDVASVTAALQTLASSASALGSHEQECLGAWLAAFRGHWPDRFGEALGPLGEALLARCTGGELDQNRHLKLRRIATENLSRMV
jgi:hypothetical protein